MSRVWRMGPYVIKTAAQASPRQFPAEAVGLQALADEGCRTPHVYYSSPNGLVLRYLPNGPPDPEGLGRQIAHLHRQRRQSYIWQHPVFIGRFELPMGTAHVSWDEFWRIHRIEPLLQSCVNRLGPVVHRVHRLLTTYEVPIEGPSIIHGDLWSGNVLMTDQGSAMIDPSVWVGERAVDLAMMRLFGGFGTLCWESYREILPIPTEIEEAIPFYQLYYVLVHVYFFGDSYLPSVDSILRKYGF